MQMNAPGSAEVDPQLHHRWPGYGPPPQQLFTAIVAAQAPVLPSHKREHQCTCYLKGRTWDQKASHKRCLS